MTDEFDRDVRAAALALVEDAPPPLVESRSKNYLTMAMEEISRGKLKFAYDAQ